MTSHRAFILLPAGLPSSRTVPANRTVAPFEQRSGPASTTGGSLCGMALRNSSGLRTGHCSLVSTRSGPAPRSQRSLPPGRGHIRCRGSFRTAADHGSGVLVLSPNIDLCRAMALLHPVVPDEPRVPDLDVLALWRLEPEDFNSRPGVVLKGASVDQAAVASGLEINAALIVTSRIGHIAEGAVAEGQSLGPPSIIPIVLGLRGRRMRQRCCFGRGSRRSGSGVATCCAHSNHGRIPGRSLPLAVTRETPARYGASRSRGSLRPGQMPPVTPIPADLVASPVARVGRATRECHGYLGSTVPRCAKRCNLR